MTGKRREGVYSGFSTSIRKFSSGIATLLLGFGLQAAGFDQNEYGLMKSSSASFSPEQYASSTVVVVIKWMFVLIPIVLLAVSFVFALRYKLNCKRFNNVLKGIEKRKADGENATFTEEELEDYRLLTGKTEKELWQGGGSLSL
jgi:oligogalacturonide transporter